MSDYYRWEYRDRWAAGNRRESFAIELIQRLLPEFTVRGTGKGVQSTEWLDGHSDPDNKMDLSIYDADGQRVCQVEVTGSDKRERELNFAYWVTGHKIASVKQNPEETGWIILIYGLENEDVVFLKVNPIRDSGLST